MSIIKWTHVTLSQACKVVTRLQWVVKILHGCDMLVTRLWPACDKLVTNMTLWSQGCKELVKLLHGCDEVVARCDKVVTRLWQGCDKLDIVVTRLQEACEIIARLWQGGGQGCDKVVAKVVTRLQGLYTTLPQPCHFCMGWHKKKTDDLPFYQVSSFPASRDETYIVGWIPCHF